MPLKNTREMEVRPPHPGEILREDFLPDYGLTVTRMAEALRVSRQTVSDLLHERRSLSPEMAVKLSRMFGNSVEFWLNAQNAIDIWDATQKLEKELSSIKPLNV